MITSTKEKALTLAIDPAKLLSTMKSQREKLKSLHFQDSTVRAHLFLNVFNYIHVMCNTERFKNTTIAFDSLSKSLKTSPFAVSNWYYAGKFMDRHKHSPSSVNAKSVFQARNTEKRIKLADFLKLLSMIKKGEHEATVGRHIYDSMVRNGHTPSKKPGGRNKLTKFTYKIELMRLQVLGKKLFGKDVDIYVHGHKSDDALMQV